MVRDPTGHTTGGAKGPDKWMRMRGLASAEARCSMDALTAMHASPYCRTFPMLWETRRLACKPSVYECPACKQHAFCLHQPLHA